MASITSKLHPWRPIARPMFGVVRGIEYLIGAGQLPFFETAMLYWTEDHLLISRRLGTTERFQRLYYADIQGVRLQRGNGQHLMTALLFVAFAACVGLSAYIYLGTGRLMPVIALAVFAALLVILLARNLQLGALCTCEVLTAVEAVRIDGVARWNVGQRFVNELASRARAAQPPLAPPLPDAPPLLLMTCAKQVRVADARDSGPLISYWHWGFFGALALVALLSIAWMVLPGYDVTLPRALYIVGHALVSILAFWAGSMAVCRQEHPAFSRRLRLTTNWVFVLSCLATAAVSYMPVVFMQFQQLVNTDAYVAVQGIEVVVGVLGALSGTLMLSDLSRRARANVSGGA